MLGIGPAAFFLVSAMSTIGEGLSSSEPDIRIDAGYRMFTTITGPEMCEATERPATLRTKPITLSVGDSLELADFVVTAHDASGLFLPSVPIQILQKDDENRALTRDLHASRYVWIAQQPGRKVFLIRDYCAGDGGAQGELLVTIE